MSFTRFTVNLPEEEATAFKRALEESEFSYNSRDRFRSNAEYAEFVRHLVQEEMMEVDTNE